MRPAKDNNSPQPEPFKDWESLVQEIGPATLLAVIQNRMSPLLRSRLAPEDLFQDALLQAWRDRNSFQWQGLRSFRAWLLTIIDHRLRDVADYETAQKRGGGRNPVSLNRGASDTSSADAIPPALAASTTPSRLAIYREQAVAMERALRSLPDELRDVVRLRLWEQREMRDIAEMLGIGVEAVRHRFRKGAMLYREKLLLELSTQGEV